MCEIGKPIEIIDVELLSLPAPLRKEKEQPTEQSVIVEVPVSERTVEPVRPADMEDDNPGCDTNKWRGNHFGKANQSCIRSGKDDDSGEDEDRKDDDRG